MKYIYLLLCLVFITACTDSESPVSGKVITVKQYMENDELRKKALDYCNESEKRKELENCMNALSAAAQKEFDDFNKIPDKLK